MLDLTGEQSVQVLGRDPGGRLAQFTPPHGRLQDRGNLGHAALMQARNQLLDALRKKKGLVAVRPNGLEDTPEFRLDIDTHKVGSLGLSIADVNDTFSAAWGSSYVNDFIDRGRVKKVFLQADAPFRMLPDDINHWFVRNSSGEMVPFSAFSTANWISGSPRLERYNGVPSVEILGMAVLAIFFVPLFFVGVQKALVRRRPATDAGAPLSLPVSH